MNLPTNYVQIDPTSAVHMATLRRFTTKPKALLEYLAINSQYDIDSDPAERIDMAAESDASLLEHADRAGELGRIAYSIAGFLMAAAHRQKDPNWPDDEPKPLLLGPDGAWKSHG